jgi:hypothetical protein
MLNSDPARACAEFAKHLEKITMEQGEREKERDVALGKAWERGNRT